MDTTPNFYKEITEYKKSGGLRHREVAEKPAPNQRDHLMDCLRYYINSEPEYIKPDKEKSEPSLALKEFKEWKKPKPTGPLDDGQPMKIGPGLAR